MRRAPRQKTRAHDHRGSQQRNPGTHHQPAPRNHSSYPGLDDDERVPRVLHCGGAARSNIERMYHDKGYYQATVTVDQKELERGSVLFVVAEGERVKVTDIRF